MKKCSYCKEAKPFSEFGKSSRSRDGFEYSCLACRRAIVRECERRNPEVKQDRQKEYRKSKRHIAVRARNAVNRRARYFGVSMLDYNAILKAQGGVCAICENPETDKHQFGTLKTLAIDHDHETGAIRGLLCGRCNKAIGGLNDSPTLLQQAIDYLKKHADDPNKKIIPFHQPVPNVESKSAAEANWDVVP